MESSILIKNVSIFNGKDETISVGNVLVDGNVISTISTDAISTVTNPSTKVIDGTGKWLMPGLIDAHWHAYMSCNTIMNILATDISFTHHVAGREANNTLMRGFTTLRDAGGPVYGLKEIGRASCRERV